MTATPWHFCLNIGDNSTIVLGDSGLVQRASLMLPISMQLPKVIRRRISALGETRFCAIISIE